MNYGDKNRFWLIDKLSKYFYIKSDVSIDIIYCEIVEEDKIFNFILKYKSGANETLGIKDLIQNGIITFKEDNLYTTNTKLNFIERHKLINNGIVAIKEIAKEKGKHIYSVIDIKLNKISRDESWLIDNGYAYLDGKTAKDIVPMSSFKDSVKPTPVEDKVTPIEVVELEDKPEKKSDDKKIKSYCEPWPDDSIELLSISELQGKRCTNIQRDSTPGKYLVSKGALGTMSCDSNNLVKLGLAKIIEKKLTTKEISVECDFKKEEKSVEEKNKISEMLKNTSLTVYEKKPHSAQDAEPYIDEELMVIADGAGGSGATLHKINNPSKINTYEKLSKIVLPDDKKYSLKSFFMAQFKDIIDSPATPYASAYWASRVLIVNFVYAFKNITHNPKKLNDYCANALNRVVNELEFKLNNTFQALLPTTLVGLWIKEETEDTVKVDVMWAGDSRASILTKDGYKPISIDHEQAEGERMTNSFSAGKPSYIDVRSYDFKKPFVLVAASDGTFDDRKNWFVERLFIRAITDANSIDEVKKNLEISYKQPSTNGKPDDTSIAFRMFGYDNFGALKADLMDRKAYIENINNTYEKNLAINKVEGGIEELESDYLLFFDRCIKERVKEISNIFADNIISGDIDACIPKNVLNFTSSYIANFNNSRKEKRDASIKKVVESILLNLEIIDDSIDISKVFNLSSKEVKRIKNKYQIDLLLMQKCIDNYKRYLTSVKDFDDAEKAYYDLLEKIDDTIEKLVKIRNKSASTPIELKKDKKVSYKNSKMMINAFDDSNLNNLGFSSLSELHNNVLNAEKAYEKELENKSALNEYKEQLNKLKELSDYLMIYEALTEEEKSKHIIYDCAISKEDLALKICDYISKDDVVKEIGNARIDLNDKTSAIDTYINSSLLRHAIMYNEIINNPKLIEERELYVSMEAEYDSLLDEFIK